MHRKNHCAQKAFAQRRLRNRCICTEKLFKNASYYTACKKYFPVLLCTRTTKLAQATVQCYFVLQSLHSTEHFPALLCTSKLAQSTSKYYFELQSVHRALPSTTLTTNLAQSTSQYDFVHRGYHFLIFSPTEAGVLGPLQSVL